MRVAIFDVDGTLVDSNHYHVLAWQEAFRAIGKDIAYAALHAQMGKGADQLIPVFCAPEEVRRHGEKLSELHSKVFAERYLDQVKPFGRVRELFELVRRDARIVLASSAKKAELEHHRRMLAVDDWVDAATSADDAERSKPCPDLLRAALALVPSAAARDAIVIGDTPYDAEAANALGMRTIGVLSGGFNADVLRAAGVIAVYRDVAELCERYHESALAKRVA